MDENFSRAWQVKELKFVPSHCEWLAWLGQPMLYDGGACVNRSPEEHEASREQFLVLSV